MAAKCFVVMPFEGFDQAYQAVQKATSTALPDQSIECYWLKDARHAGRITDDIITGLRESALCVADVTGNNPNVMWETGYAMALGKPTILIGQLVEKLPFDLKDHRILPYRPEALEKLADDLSEAVRQTMARYDIGEQAVRQPQAERGSLVIAVTGTMQARQARVRRRISEILPHYLSPETLWYCGGRGETDESVARFLVQHDQRLVVVGWDRYDCSPYLLELVRSRKAAFLDASLERLPKGLTGSSPRDILFCTKADLVILFWDAQSLGTRQMAQYFQESGQNYLLAHV